LQIIIKKIMKKMKKINQNPPTLRVPSLENGGLKNGFTLFELLVSISIIGIMTALVSVAYSGAQKKARDARRVEDIKSIQTAAEQYYSQNSYVYPADNTTPWAGGGQNILEVFPSDPKPSPYVDYTYTHPDGTNTTYCSCATVENTSNGNATAACTFATPSASTTLFCAKNQQ